MRMFVFSNLAISLDGKIATYDRSPLWLGTAEDRRQMQVLRRRSDVVLTGASTLRSFRRPYRILGAKHQPMNAILSRTLDGISPEWPFFREPSIRRVLFVTGPIPKKRIALFEKSSELVRLRSTRPLAPQILNHFKAIHAYRVLVEGGGEIMWEFVSGNLIDEVHLTLTPRIIGGKEAPSLVEGKGFSPKEVLNLKLARCRKVGEELYLTYRKSFRRTH